MNVMSFSISVSIWGKSKHLLIILIKNDNVTVKFIEVKEEYTDVLIAISDIDYEVIRIDFKGLFDIPSIYDWITFEINRRINNMLQDYIYKR